MPRRDSVTTSQNLGGAPKGNVNAMSCGAYSKRLFSEDEHRLFETMVSQLGLDFPTGDQSKIEEVAVCYVQFLRAVEADNTNAIAKLDSKMRKYLKALKNPSTNQARSAYHITYDEWLEKMSKIAKQ